MNSRMLAFSLTALFLGGCSSQSAVKSLPANHPASPNAAEAPIPIPSDTLSMEHNTTALPSPGKPAMEGMDAMPHGMHGHDMHGMQGMSNDHGMPADHAAPGTMPGGGSSPAATQAAYQCPMHATVTSEQPGKCPICHMNLVKKEAKQ